MILSCVRAGMCLWSFTVTFIGDTAVYPVCLCEVLALKLGMYFCYVRFHSYFTLIWSRGHEVDGVERSR